MVAKRLLIVVVSLLAVGAEQLSGAEALSRTIQPQAQSRAVRDVALHAGGVLAGQVVDVQGAAVAGAVVTISKVGKQIARVEADAHGRFRVDGLKGGVHQVVAAGQVGIYRLWAPNTAPPVAQSGIMLVKNTEVVRGQCVGCGTPVCGTPGCGSGVYGRGAAGGGVVGWMANHPVLTAGGIAAAIAVPLAIDDDDPPASP